MDTLTLDGLPARGADEQEEREAQLLLAARPTPPVLVNWTKASRARLQDGTLRPKLMLIATDHAGCLLIHHLVAAGTKQVAGSLVLPEVSMASNTVEPSAGDASCYVYSAGADAEVLLVACQYNLPALPGTRATDVAAALLTHCRPAHTVVLATASTSSSALRGASPPPGGAFAASTDAAASSSAAAAPSLPPGCVIDGLPAALLSHCQIRGVSLRVLLSMEQAPVTDAAAVVAVLAALRAEVAAAAAVCAPLAGLLSTEKFSAMVKAVDKERDASSFGAIFA